MTVPHPTSDAPSPTPTAIKGGRSAVFVAGVVAALLTCCGCDRDIDTTYGAVRGASINGLAAFVQLLRDTGHTTTARQQLPERIDAEFHTVVVVDDSYTGLRAEARRVLETWLNREGVRTLLLVLRDSDATIDYLRDILTDDLSPDRRTAAEALLAGLERDIAAATTGPRTATTDFFDGLDPADRGPAPAVTEVLAWEPNADPTPIAARWELRRRMRSRSSGRTIWESGPDRLLVRHRRAGGERLVLASAAPLLNGGLVDPGNRHLAERLAAMLPTEGKLLLVGSSRVAVGEGGDDAPGDGDSQEAGDEEPSPWRLLSVQPLPWLATQAIVALGLFCWCMAPIFGRPLEVPATHAQNFGHHVDALAGLFSKSPTDGPAFARQRLEEWRATAPARTGHRRRRP